MHFDRLEKKPLFLEFHPVARLRLQRSSEAGDELGHALLVPHAGEAEQKADSGGDIKELADELNRFDAASRSADQRCSQCSLGEADEEKRAQHAPHVIADLAERDSGGSALREIHVEEESAETGPRNAEQQPQTEQNRRVEEKREVARVEAQREERRDQRERHEVAGSDRQREQLFVVSVATVQRTSLLYRRPQSTPATALPIAAPTPKTRSSDDAYSSDRGNGETRSME